MLNTYNANKTSYIKKIYFSILIFTIIAYCYFSYQCFFGALSQFDYNFEIYNTVVFFIVLFDWLSSSIFNKKFSQTENTHSIKISLLLIVAIIFIFPNSFTIETTQLGEILQKISTQLSFLIGLGTFIRRIILVSIIRIN